MAALPVNMSHENLDEYLLERLNAATKEEILKIPKPLRIRVVGSQGFAISARLNALEKFYILYTLGCNIFYLIEDSEKGMDKESFDLLKKAKKRGGPLAGRLVEDQHAKGYIVLGNQEMVDAMRYARNASVSKYFRLIRTLSKRPPGQRDKRSAEHRAYIRWLVNSFTLYDGTKKRFFAQNNLMHAEWYALLFFAKGEGTYGQLIESDFGTSFSSSYPMFRRGLKNLTERKLLIRTGGTGGYRYNISSEGMDMLEKMFKLFLV